MNSIPLFLEMKIEAFEKGRHNAKLTVEYLTNLLNHYPQEIEYLTYINPVSYYPQPHTRVAKVFEDCYQLFVIPKQGFPRLMNIIIFFKGKVYENNFLIRIDEERHLCEIEDIQMGDIQNHGIGSVCLRNLEDVLRGKQLANRIIAGITPHDYDRREHLYHFYHNKNNYKIKHEVTRNSWGLVEKLL